ncbi:MAG: AgmX/PglI C-terminal domain-containing protein [Myxococcales bacterium]|nr:AgmX/PglI C-terminal domain-containing protein [Myxococcales bacterium]
MNLPAAVRPLVPVAAALLFAAACSGGGASEEMSARNKSLADDLLKCQTEKSSMKEQMQVAQAEVRKMKEASQPNVLELGAIELQAGPRQVESANLSPEQVKAVKKVIVSNGGALVSCYEKGLKRNPNLRTVSSVTARFLLNPTGSATGTIFNPHVDAEMERCMAQGFGKWKFPTFTGGGVQVEFPVSLVAR